MAVNVTTSVTTVRRLECGCEILVLSIAARKALDAARRKAIHADGTRELLDMRWCHLHGDETRWWCAIVAAVRTLENDSIGAAGRRDVAKTLREVLEWYKVPEPFDEEADAGAILFSVPRCPMCGARVPKKMRLQVKGQSL